MTQPAEPIAVHKLTAWLRTAGLIDGEELHLSPLAGGRSHVMARITHPQHQVLPKVCSANIGSCKPCKPRRSRRRALSHCVSMTRYWVHPFT